MPNPFKASRAVTRLDLVNLLRGAGRIGPDDRVVLEFPDGKIVRADATTLCTVQVLSDEPPKPDPDPQ